MLGLGTLINGSAIIIGGLLGLGCKNVFSKKLQDTLIKATGAAIIFMGIGGVMEHYLNNDNVSMLIIVSMVIGALIGEVIDIEDKLKKFGKWLKIKTKSEGDNQFLDAFIMTSLTVCIGAMAIVGAIEDGIYGDYSLLLAKSVLDFIIVMIMSSSLGKGCIFSCIPVMVFQGIITVLAVFIAPFFSGLALANLSMVGSILIFLVGINLTMNMQIKVANMLPAIFIAAIFAFI